jgi:integrase
MPQRVNDGLRKRCGCARRIWAKCKHPWHMNFFHGEREHRLSLAVEAVKRNEQPPTTRAEALQWRDRLRAEIREGKFTTQDAPTPDPAAPLTFGDVCDQYLRDHVRVATRREKGQKLMEMHIRLARETEIPAAHGTTVRLEAKPITAITAADLRALRAARVAASQAKCAATKRRDAKSGEAGANRLMQRVRHVFTWAIENNHLTDSPFRKGHVTIVKANRSAETPRDRRLTGDEEARLLEAAERNPHLYALIVAALTTGCRKGELLTMQWSQACETPKPAIRLSAAHTKTAKPRTVPLTPRLKAVLTMRKTAPDGKEHAPDAYVFGNEVGEPVKCIKTAWSLACQRAKITDLHFHDLRRECGSRWHEAGVPLAQIQAWLGHTTLTQTSTYLNITDAGADEWMRRLESAPGFAHHSHKATEQPPASAADAQASDPAHSVVM